MRKLVLAVAAAVVAVALWWRKNPSACPYNQRFWVEAPHPLITRARLREALAPQPGERILEVGPGTGYYSLPVAEWLGPDGTLEILDLQQDMLDHTSGRAREAGLGNVVATQGDARSLPYGDDAFDGAFLVTVLGEVPDQQAALRELRRVVRPGCASSAGSARRSDTSRSCAGPPRPWLDPHSSNEWKVDHTMVCTTFHSRPSSAPAAAPATHPRRRRSSANPGAATTDGRAPSALG